MIRTRPGLPRDLGRLTEIFNDYVLNSHITFDERPSTLEQRKAWFKGFSTGGLYRLFVAEDASGSVLGCAYSTRYSEHPAFDRTVETSIYLDPAACGRGVGSLLYSHLLGELAKQPVHRAVASIALPNEPSVALHRRFGYRDVGVFEETAFKRGRAVSTLWLQRDFAGT